MLQAGHRKQMFKNNCTDRKRKFQVSAIADDLVEQSQVDVGCTKLSPACPLWVKSGHCPVSARCPLYPQKRTLVPRVKMSALCQKRTWANIDLACVGCRHVPLVCPLFQCRRTALTRPLPHARTSRPYPQIDNCRPRRTTRFERNAPTSAQTSLAQSYAHHTAGTHLLLL
jgi:hypothetical protein